MDNPEEKGKYGHLTISRVSSNMRNDFIHIEINDCTSGLIIWRGEMELEDFAKVLTGIAHVKVFHKFVPTKHTVERLGKERIIKHIIITGVNRYFDRIKDRCKKGEEVDRLTREQFKELFNEGWEILSNGVGTRQEDPNNGWSVVLVKFVDKENKNDSSD